MDEKTVKCYKLSHGSGTACPLMLRSTSHWSSASGSLALRPPPPDISNRQYQRLQKLKLRVTESQGKHDSDTMDRKG
jgi:hypothetical protein